MLGSVRGRHALLTVMTGLLACGWVGLQAAGAAGGSTVCGPAGAHTLASDAVARVYSQGEKVYGCAAGSHSSYALGTTSSSMGEERVGPIALAGVDAGFGRTSFGVDVISAEVVVERLTDGVVLRDRAATAGSFGPEYAQQVHSVVVKRDGSVAWIASISSITSHNSATQVRKSDRTPHTSLDSGLKIRPDSLRLHGSQLSWRNAGARKTATLR
jgi:hypothetical protein